VIAAVVSQLTPVKPNTVNKVIGAICFWAIDLKSSLEDFFN
jgi:hypothetical protein